MGTRTQGFPAHTHQGLAVHTLGENLTSEWIDSVTAQLWCFVAAPFSASVSLLDKETEEQCLSMVVL